MTRILQEHGSPTVLPRMQISGGSGAGAGALYSALVAGKIQQSVKQQGRDVIQLLDASSVGSTQMPPGVGEHLNIKA